MFGGHGANQRVMLLEPRRTDPFVKRVDRVALSHRQINHARRSGQQRADDQFKEESGHRFVLVRLIVLVLEKV